MRALRALTEVTHVLPSSTRYASVLGIFRILTGLWWLIHGYLKLTSHRWGGPTGMGASIMQQMASGSSGPYHDFMAGVVVPHAATFAMLVAVGETLVGVSLTLGLLTIVGGVGAVFLLLNYWIAGGGYSELGGYSGLETAMMILSAINIALPTGKAYGLDGVLFGRARSA